MAKKSKMRFIERPSPKNFTVSDRITPDNMPGSEIDALIQKTLADGDYAAVTLSISLSMTGEPKQDPPEEV